MQQLAFEIDSPHMNLAETQNTHALACSSLAGQCAPTTPYDHFRYWVQEREQLRVRKQQGQTPWTTNPIISKYRFTNVRRKDDRVSRWILQHIVDPYRDHPHLWLMLAIARWINWPPTLQELMDEGVWPMDEPDWKRMAAVVDARKQRGDKVWTSAYTIHAENSPKSRYYKTTKGQEVFRGYLGEALWPNRARVQAALQTHRQRDVHRVLSALHGWGSFMAGQVVADYTWTPILHECSDLYTWAPLGPGSQRGLNRLREKPIGASISEAVAVAQMIELRARLVRDLPMLADVNLMETQNVCCEADKFIRTVKGEGRPKTIYRPETAY